MYKTKKLMKYLSIIMLIVFFFSCSSYKYKLENDSIIKQHFNEDEIKDLEEIIEFFDNEIQQQYRNPDKDIYKSYENFFENLSTVGKAADIQNKIGISQARQRKILKEIEKSLFDKLWYYETGYRPLTNDSILSLNVNYLGEYMAFLKSVAKVDTTIRDYYKPIEASGCIPPSLIAGVINYYQNYDLTKKRIRLILAIHYLTVNDQPMKE